jgi:hypothetical protein
MTSLSEVFAPTAPAGATVPASSGSSGSGSGGKGSGGVRVEGAMTGVLAAVLGGMVMVWM